MGALTSKPYAFTSRSWELKTHNTFDFFDILLSKIRFDYRGEEVLRVLPIFDERTNEEFIIDRTRFFYDALKNQRVSSLFFRKTNKFSIGTWENFFFLALQFYLNTLLVNGSISFRIGDFLSLNAMAAISKFSYFFSNKGVLYNKSFIHLCDFRATFFSILNSLDFKANLSGVFLFISYNIRSNLPIFSLKLRRAVFSGKCKVLTHGFFFDDTFKTYNIGMSFFTLLPILQGRSPLFRVLLRNNEKSFHVFLGQAVFVFYNLLKTRFASVHCLSNSLTVLSFLELGFLDKKAVWSSIENVTNDAFSLISFGNKNFVLTTHPFEALEQADAILPLKSIFEQNGVFFDVLGNLIFSTGLPFTTNRTCLRQESDLFVSLFFFFDLFLRNNLKTHNVSGFLFNFDRFSIMTTPSLFSLAVLLNNLPFSLPADSFFNLTKNNLLVGNVFTRASKFLILGAKRFGNKSAFL